MVSPPLAARPGRWSVQAIRTLQRVGNKPSCENATSIAHHSRWIADAYAWNAQVPVEFLDVRVQRGGFVTLNELSCRYPCAKPDYH